jgi:hypothetical protein
VAYSHTTAKPSPAHTDHAGHSPRARSEPPSLPTVEEQAVLAEVGPKGPKRPAIERRSDSVARSKRQAASSRTVEDGAGSVRKPRATTLLVPEEKRCEALTTLGARCKAPRLRGLKVCMFHGHLAADDERLAALADPKGSAPPLSPRRALKAVAALRAGEIAVEAVAGALAAAPRDGGASLLRLVDAVDPVVETTTTLRLTSPSEVDGLSFAELTKAVRALTPSDGSVEPDEGAQGREGQQQLLEAHEA